ncbi:MAG: hypothetical protein ACJAWV_003869 [Flammeovirgaceae bacterium]|jgi:hypothetical protein
MLTIPDKRRWFEIIAVAITAIGKFIFMDFLKWKLPFILTVMLFWGIYMFLRKRELNGILNYWGFQKSSFGRAFKMILPFGLVAFIACFIIGYFNNTLNLSWHIIPILLIYPIWGMVQQFLLISLVAGNLSDLKSQKLNSHFVVFISAFLFGVIHYPFPWLMSGTSLLAIFYGYVFLKVRNLFV